MEQEFEVLVLENNEKYLPVKILKLNGIIYYVLINIRDEKDVCIRKEIIENGETLISMLDSESELYAVLAEYKKMS